MIHAQVLIGTWDKEAPVVQVPLCQFYYKYQALPPDDICKTLAAGMPAAADCCYACVSLLK